MTRALVQAAFAGTAIMLAACNGSFGSAGTAAPVGGVNPPVNPQGNMPMPYSPPPKASPTASGAITPPPGTTATYALADVQQGLKCPEDQGYTCTLAFTIATPAPSRSPSASPSSSPTPTPSPAASPGLGASPSGSPSPTPMPAGTHLTIAISARPTDAPKMVNPNPKAVGTIALVRLHLRTDANVTLHGKASADFTLPKDQIGGRGFALQLFYEVVQKHKTLDKFAGSYNESKLLKNGTLNFSFNVPPLQIKKNEDWMLVLYGDEFPSATQRTGATASPLLPAPSGSPSASPTASPLSSPSPSASP